MTSIPPSDPAAPEVSRVAEPNRDRRKLLAGIALAFGGGCIAGDAGLVSSQAHASTGVSPQSTGSPEGVVVGEVGDLYIQTDGEHGRTLWRKREGSGTTGWGLMQGDTGVFNVQDYGARGDGSTDDTAAFQACFDDAELGTVIIPNGTYRLTDTIMVPQGTSILGFGYRSILKFHGCHGLTFTVSNAIGPVVVENLHIWGQGCEEFAAIRIPGTSDVNQRVTGVSLENLYLAFWGTGVFARNLWHSRLYGMTMNHVYTGIEVRGRSVKNVIDSCSLQRGSIGGMGTARGIVVDSSMDFANASEARPEDVSIVRTIVFGYAIGIDWLRCLYGAIENNDIDYCTHTGIRIQQSDGGLVVAHNWITVDTPGATTGTAQFGVQLIDLGSVSGGRLDLRGNHIMNQAATPSSSSYGISLGRNQHNIFVEHNEIGGFGQLDIYTQYGKEVHIEKNLCRSTHGLNSIYVISSVGPITLDKNTVARPIFVHPHSNHRVTVGETFGAQSTLIRGRSTLPAHASSVTTTFASLNGSPANFIGGYPSFLPGQLTVETPPVNLGAIWGTASDTGVTIFCSTPPTSGPVVLRWIVRTCGALD